MTDGPSNNDSGWALFFGAAALLVVALIIAIAYYAEHRKPSVFRPPSVEAKGR